MHVLIVALLVIVLIVCFGSREGFADIGFSGYRKPVGRFAIDDTIQPVDVTSMEQIEAALTTAEVSSIIRSIQLYVKDNHSVCLEPIQTIYINKYSPDIYNARIMFYNKTHLFATELVATLNGTDTVASIRTHVPSGDVSGPAGYTDTNTATFTSTNEFLESVSPSKTAMDAAVSAIAQDTNAYNSA